jgi:hypothetical protein
VRGSCGFCSRTTAKSLYGGAAGGGKTAALLMAALQYVDKPGYAALILRRTYPQLTQPGNLIPALEGVARNDGREWNEQLKQWRFPAGSTLTFGHVQDEQAVFNYQGGAYQFVGFDELTQFSETQFTYIAFSRQRRNLAMEQMGVPIRTRSTSNPGGIGHAWVKNRYLDKPAAGAIFIPAKVKDNPGLTSRTTPNRWGICLRRLGNNFWRVIGVRSRGKRSLTGTSPTMWSSRSSSIGGGSGSRAWITGFRTQRRGWLGPSTLTGTIWCTTTSTAPHYRLSLPLSS